MAQAIPTASITLLRGVNFIVAFFTITVSGNYATGGEIPSPTIQALNRFNGRAPLFVIIQGKAGFVYSYDSATGKVLVYCNTAGGANAALGEHTAAAYAAGVAADVIRGMAVYAN